MRLKCIKMAGFKSFVDLTTVVLPSNLCAIVGPNGCGKSNIIDAVRWVMGESSAKQLRGESLTDVIFNGSGSRKAIGLASVELIFDNSEGKLGGEYANWGEISIKRKVSRDGQSNYYLNGDKCRRRDITDIFLGTGLGPRSYAIIEQGMISSLIDAKPEELRVYIEEAAGISKYKERRRDTENRIKRTKENLDRLGDIRQELGNQISRLERQAKSAEKFTELKRDERATKAKLLAIKWRDIYSETQNLSKNISDYELKVEKISAEKTQCSTMLEKHRDNYTRLVDSLNLIQGRYYSVGSEVTRIQQSIQYANDRSIEIKKDLEEIEQNFIENKDHLALDIKTKESLEHELKKIQPMLKEAILEQSKSELLLKKAEREMNDCQLYWDDFIKSSSIPAQQVELQQSRIEHLEQLINQLDEKIERLILEIKGTTNSTFENDLSELEVRISKVDLELREKLTKLDESAEQINIVREEYSILDSNLNEKRTQLQSLLGKRSSLEQIVRSILSIDKKKEEWFKVNKIEKNHRLSEKIKVSPGWESAVDVVLGNSLQAVFVESISDLSDDIKASIESELLLVEGSESAKNKISIDLSNSLLSKVEGKNFDSYLKPILQNVMIHNTLSSALKNRKNLEIGQSIITKEGVWLGKDWIRVESYKDATKGLLKRKKELESLELKIKNLHLNTEKLEEQKNASEKKLRELEDNREKDRQFLITKQNYHSELNTKISNIKIQLDHISSRNDRFNLELNETKGQRAEEQQKLTLISKELNSSLVDLRKKTEEKAKLAANRKNKIASLEKTRELFRLSKDQAHEIAMKERAASTKLQFIIEGIVRLEKQANRLDSRKKQLYEISKKDDSPEADLQANLAEQLELRLKIEKELKDSRKEVENLESIMRDTEQEQNALDIKIQQERTLLEQKKITAQDFQTRSQTLSEQIIEYGHNLKELLLSVPESQTSADLDLALEKLTNRIHRLGPINLAAIDEFNTESERKHYLDKQNDDLEEALTTLENAIRKIDKETRSRFKETFDLVDKSFQDLFPKLFGGGKSYLELTSDDLLEAGVSIMARPPGKKNTTIHLLSGGEKAMTAIALVFSIFHLNPAPFCMLDEVDAPLDDSNVLRYAKIVEEISSSVQIVYISHNKNAMEMANQLVGVTMHEAGVSRLVSVDIDQAVELAKT
ncbi:MAG: chromosome segregation protein SMC [Porticoccus sp.]|nr:chromosome segregation protein SMC [Porticoccus sp.]